MNVSPALVAVLLVLMIGLFIACRGNGSGDRSTADDRIDARPAQDASSRSGESPPATVTTDSAKILRALEVLVAEEWDPTKTTRLVELVSALVHTPDDWDRHGERLLELLRPLYAAHPLRSVPKSAGVDIDDPFTMASSLVIRNGEPVAWSGLVRSLDFGDHGTHQSGSVWTYHEVPLSEVLSALERDSWGSLRALDLQMLEITTDETERLFAALGEGSLRGVTHLSMPVVHGFVLTDEPGSDAAQAAYSAWADTLSAQLERYAATPAAAKLRSLWLDEQFLDWPIAPRQRALRAVGALSGLRYLGVWAAVELPSDLELLLSRPWPHLETLVLGPAATNTDDKRSILAMLGETKSLPALRTLKIEIGLIYADPAWHALDEVNFDYPGRDHIRSR